MLMRGMIILPNCASNQLPNTPHRFNTNFSKTGHLGTSRGVGRITLDLSISVSSFKWLLTNGHSDRPRDAPLYLQKPLTGGRGFVHCWFCASLPSLVLTLLFGLRFLFSVLLHDLHQYNLFYTFFCMISLSIWLYTLVSLFLSCVGSSVKDPWAPPSSSLLRTGPAALFSWYSLLVRY